MHPQTFGFEAFYARDTVGFVNTKTLKVYTEGVVKTAKLINLYEMELTFVGKLPSNVKEGDCIENITWTPEVIIRNSYFEKNPARGLLITTRREVLIENNTIAHMGMHAILIANDCNFWYESSPVRDVTIRNNKFIQCGYQQGNHGYVIAIQPEVIEFDKGEYNHSNIKIYDNEFYCVGKRILFARSVKGLNFGGNKIIHSPMDGYSGSPNAWILLEHCTDVKVEKNEFKGFSTPTIEVKSMLKKNVETDGGYEFK